jgi:hypothetical protein
MKSAVIIIAIAGVISLTGCNSSNSGDSYIESSIDSEVIIVDDESTNEDEESTQEYTGTFDENYSIGTAVNTDSGIKIGSVNIADSYQYTGKVIDQPETTSDTTEEALEDPVENSEVTDEVSDDTISEEIVPEETTSTEEIVYIPDESITDTVEESLSYLYEKVVNGMYYNYLVLLGGATDVEEYNESHIDNIDSTLNKSKAALGNIENCDKIISAKLSSYDDVVSSWNNLKTELNSLREQLSDVSTGEEFVESKIEIGTELEELVDSFGEALKNHMNS